MHKKPPSTIGRGQFGCGKIFWPCRKILSILLLRFKARAAEYRAAIFARAERQAGDAATFCALGFEHFALAAVAAFAIVTAVFATAGLVFKAFFRIEFLFTLGEDEFVVAVPTDESFVFVHVPIYLA